jgi:MFS family permease
MPVMLMAALDSTVVPTALPDLGDLGDLSDLGGAGDLGGLGGLDHIAWVTTAYLLAQTVVTPLYGKLGDLFGRKVVLQAGLAIFPAGLALSGPRSPSDRRGPAEPGALRRADGILRRTMFRDGAV